MVPQPQHHTTVVLAILGIWVLVGLFVYTNTDDMSNALAGTFCYPEDGCTGSSTLSGILVGNGKNPVKTLVVGSNLTFDGTTLTSTGGSGTVSGGIAGMLTAWTAADTLTATGTPTAASYVATSTTASVFPYASTTGITATTFWGALTGNVTGTASGNDVLGQATSTLTSHTTTYNHDNFLTTLTPWTSDINAAEYDITNLGDVTFKTGAAGGTLRTGTTSADKIEIQAYDTDDAVYRKVLEADAGDTPTLEVFADSFAIWDNTDETKRLSFGLVGGATGITTGLAFAPTANRVHLFPDKTGIVAHTSDIAAIQLGQLSDVSTTSLAAYDVLYWTGSEWARTATSSWDTNTTYTAGDALTLTGTDIDFDGGATPGGELGGTWASPTIDDSLAVTSWNLTTPTITTNFTFDGVTVTGLTGADTSIVTGTAGNTDDCAKWNADGDLVSAGAACGSGGGGSISGWATTTSSVTGQLNLYPTLATDILNVGGSATTSSEFWVDPNTVTAQLNGSNGTSSVVVGSSNNEWVLGTSDADKSFRIASSTAQLDGITAGLTLSKTGVLTVSNASTTWASATRFYGDLTGTASLATALGVNGSNCSSGSAPLGVDASGAVESCFDVWTEAENTSAAYQNAANVYSIVGATTTLPLLSTLAGLTSFGTDAATTTAQGDIAADAFGIVGKFFANASQLWTSLTMVFTNGFTVSGGTVDMIAATVKQHRYPSFSWPGGVANATTTTATTTIPLGTAFVANAYNSAECWTGSGTTTYQVSDGTNKTEVEFATTSVSRFALTTNNTFTAGEKRFIDVGPLTATYISCSFDITEN